MTGQGSSQAKAKRFYDAAWAQACEDGWQILLDRRPVKTPLRGQLLLPTKALAEAVAAEWEAQEAEINPTTMPLTRLANSAIDRAAPRREEIVQGLVAFGETDLLCYRAEWPQKLVTLQAEAWDPIVDWAKNALGADLRVVSGVMHIPQPPEAVAALESELHRHDDFTLTAMNQMATLTVSLVLTLAVVRDFLSAEEAWRAAHVDEDWQISQWGEDAEARARRDAQWADMAAAARFLVLLQQRD